MSSEPNLMFAELGDLRRSNRILLGLAAVGQPDWNKSERYLMLAGPDTFTLGDSSGDREAILLECCDLADKKLTLDEADLDGIVSRFVALNAAPVPVKVEHIDSVLDPLGRVQRIWRDGKRLMGNLAFAPAMADFLRERGPVKLSCGLKRMSDDLRTVTLTEVSLVLKPRIASACLLSDDEQSELLRLRIQVQQQKVDAQVVSLKLAGKIVPATEAAARVLLMADDHSQITLADGNSLAVAEAFAAFLAAQPPLVVLSELKDLTALSVSSTADGNGATELTVDQREFLEKSLGVNADHAAAMMSGDKKTPSAMMHAPARKVTVTDTHRTTETRKGM